jgi:hypothetical protein
MGAGADRVGYDLLRTRTGIASARSHWLTFQEFSDLNTRVRTLWTIHGKTLNPH